MLLGQYRPLNSYLNRLDARSKLVAVLMVMVLGLLTDSLWFYLIALAAVLLGLSCSGVGFRTIASSLRPILILVGITFLYHIIFTGRDSRPLIELGGVALTEEGLSKAAFFSLRLLIFVSVVFLVTLTSSPSELAEAMARIIRPLRRFKVPVNDLGLILFIAMRFIPVLYQEFLAIRNAQAIRGVDFSGSLIKKVRRLTAIIVPVLVAAISRADELALAMEARGYRGGVRRTFYSRAAFDGRAWLFVVLSSLFFLAVYRLTGG